MIPSKGNWLTLPATAQMFSEYRIPLINYQTDVVYALRERLLHVSIRPFRMWFA